MVCSTPRGARLFLASEWPAACSDPKRESTDERHQDLVKGRPEESAPYCRAKPRRISPSRGLALRSFLGLTLRCSHYQRSRLERLAAVWAIRSRIRSRMDKPEKHDPSEELRSWGLDLEDPKGWMQLYEAAIQADEESSDEQSFAE